MNTKAQQHYFDIQSHRYINNCLITPELNALHNALHLKPKTTLIDFGSGNGRVSLYFLKKGYDIIAVDISKHSLEELEVLYESKKTSSWGKLTTSSSLPKIRVDGIVGADILHHVEITKILPKLITRLKPSGRIAFSEPNAWHLPWYLYLAFKHLPWSIERGIVECSYPNLQRLFTDAKYSNISISTFTPFLHTIHIDNLWPWNYVGFRLIISATQKK